MSRAGWSPEDREEWAEALEEAWLSGETTEERIDALEGILHDALQARRYWARDVERECLRAGLNREVVAWGKSRQPMISITYKGRVISKPRRRGVAVRDGSGIVTHQQALWEEMTWDQLDQVYANRLQQAQTLGDELRVIERIRALRTRHPQTASVAEALLTEGVSLDEWLASA
jgi:hypothetical protein